MGFCYFSHYLAISSSFDPFSEGVELTYQGLEFGSDVCGHEGHFIGIKLGYSLSFSEITHDPKGSGLRASSQNAF